MAFDFVTYFPDLVDDYTSAHWSDRRDMDLTSGRFSPENPVLDQLRYVTNKQDYKALLSMAIAEESKLADYKRQLADQERLTAEAREYSSYSSDVARMREAGLNPDLLGSAGSSGGSGGAVSVSPPSTASAVPMSVEMSSPYGTADRVFAGISSVSSFLSAFSGFATQAFDLVKGVATFGDFLSMSDSNRRISAANADLVEGLVGPQLQQSGQSAASARMSGIYQLASTLDLSRKYTDEELIKIISDAGHRDPDGGYLADLRRVMSKPDLISRFNQDKARSDTYTYDFLMELIGNESKALLYQSRSDVINTRFKSLVDSLTNVSSAANVEADAISIERSNRLSMLEQKNKEIQDFASAYAYNQESLVQEIRNIDLLIEEISLTPQEFRTHNEQAMLDVLPLMKNRLIILGNQNHNEVFVSAMKRAYLEYLNGKTNERFWPGLFPGLRDKIDIWANSGVIDIVFGDQLSGTKSADEVSHGLQSLLSFAFGVATKGLID